MEKRTQRTRLRIQRVGEALLATAGAAGFLTVAPNAVKLFDPVLKKKLGNTKSREVKRNIDSLVRSGIFKITKDGKGNSVLRLTPKGRWEYMLRHPSLGSRRGKKWDGKWRVLIFDVPNDKTGIRNEMRRAMRLYGFKMIQKSVWVYPHPCDDFVGLLRSHLGVSSDVLYMTADMIENDKELRREFDLR